jgi:hypothetical protein
LILLVCLLAGRTKAIRKFHEHTQGYQDAEINARLVAYCSDQAHSSVEKAALIGLVRMRFIEADENLSLRGGALKEAIEEDIKSGLIPFWVRNLSPFNYVYQLSALFQVPRLFVNEKAKLNPIRRFVMPLNFMLKISFHFVGIISFSQLLHDHQQMVSLSKGLTK